MKTYNLISVLLLGTITAMGAFAQEVSSPLKIEDAVALALENNFSIKIAKNNHAISSNNAAIGNAGFLPSVSLIGGYNYAEANTNTRFANPAQPPIDANGAATTTYNAGLNLNYNIYSGGSRSYNYRKLKNEEQRGQLQERQAIEQSVLNVLTQYLNAVNLYEAYQTTQESVSISRDRYQRAREGYNFGSFSKLELLNAEVDLSNDSTSMAQARLSYEKARKNLSNTIGIDPATPYEVSAVFTYSENLEKETLLEKALQYNVDHLLAKNAIESSTLDEKIARSEFLPRLDLSAGYTYNRATYEANFLSATESYGWNAGLNLSFDIFGGGNKKRALKNARIRKASETYNAQQSQNTIKTQLLNSYEDYTTILSLLALLEKNLALAATSYERSKVAFSTGQITGIALRESQLNLLNARYNYSTQRIQAKLAEVTLYTYTGTLVK